MGSHQPPRPTRPKPADAEALCEVAKQLESEAPDNDPQSVTLGRVRARLGWGYTRADRAYHELDRAGRWRWRRLEDHPGREEDAYRPTEADIEAVRESWTPEEERRRRRWQIRPASIRGADRYGV